MEKEKTENKCDKCEQRREDGFSFCLCGNRLWDSGFKFKSFSGTGNSHQGIH